MSWRCRDARPVDPRPPADGGAAHRCTARRRLDPFVGGRGQSRPPLVQRPCLALPYAAASGKAHWLLAPSQRQRPDEAGLLPGVWSGGDAGDGDGAGGGPALDHRGRLRAGQGGGGVGPVRGASLRCVASLHPREPGSPGRCSKCTRLSARQRHLQAGKGGAFSDRIRHFADRPRGAAPGCGPCTSRRRPGGVSGSTGSSGVGSTRPPPVRAMSPGGRPASRGISCPAAPDRRWDTAQRLPLRIPSCQGLVAGCATGAARGPARSCAPGLARDAGGLRLGTAYSRYHAGVRTVCGPHRHLHTPTPAG